MEKAVSDLRKVTVVGDISAEHKECDKQCFMSWFDIYKGILLEGKVFDYISL